MMHQVTFLLFLLSFSVGDAYKVLFFCLVPAHSHQKMYKEVYTKLSLKGHQVFAVTPLPDFNQSLTNLTEYDISSVKEFEEKQIKPEWKVAFFKKPTFLGTIIRQFIIQKIAGDGMDFLYNHPEVQRLVKEHNSFDLCVLEWFHPAVAVYSHLFGCPLIGLGSNSLPTQMLDSVWNPAHPLVAPEQDLPILRNKITFFQRVWSTFWFAFVRFHHKYFVIPSEDARIRKYYGNNVPYLGDLQYNISLLILNRNPAFHRPIPMNPNVIEIGYLNYQKTATKVDSRLQKFLDESIEGVVYFSLGISMEGTSMPKQYVTELQTIFRDLPYKVVWKWENSTMVDQPSNVFIAKFLPQVYVLGNPSHPVVNPDMNLPLRVNLGFMERVVSVLYSVYVRLYYNLVVLPREDRNVKDFFKEDLPYLGEVEKNVSVLLMNRNPAFHRPMPLYPNVVELGGIKFPLSKSPLEDGLKSMLDQASEGVIYFSLGSNVKSIFLNENTISKLQSTFASLPYKVLWKWENDIMQGKPDNVFITKWVSQVTLLEHPNVKLFITQGGLQSTEEAIAAHKPIIGIPFHSDQTTNVDTCVQYGMGKMIDLEELSELRNYILEVIDDPSYAANAKKLDQLLKDQPQDGVEKAIWWIEYVIRHKGAKHLRSVAVNLPLWQYFMLDVLAFFLLILTSFLLIVYLVFKSVFRLICGRKVSKSKSKRE